MEQTQRFQRFTRASLRRLRPFTFIGETGRDIGHRLLVMTATMTFPLLLDAGIARRRPGRTSWLVSPVP